MAGSHAELAERAAGTDALERLVRAVDDAVADPELAEERMSRWVLDAPDSSNALLSRSIIRLWYTGFWKSLPKEWHDEHGGEQLTDHVVNAEAYRRGLVWPTIGSHPQGAMPPGFATWALPPKSFEEIP